MSWSDILPVIATAVTTLTGYTTYWADAPQTWTGATAVRLEVVGCEMIGASDDVRYESAPDGSLLPTYVGWRTITVRCIAESTRQATAYAARNAILDLQIGLARQDISDVFDAVRLAVQAATPMVSCDEPRDSRILSRAGIDLVFTYTDVRTTLTSDLVPIEHIEADSDLTGAFDVP